jgi:trigger factor
MNINVEQLPNCRAVLNVEVPAATVKQERQKVVAYFASQASLPGYRPGKVPSQVIEKRHKEAIDGEVTHRLLNDSITKAIREQDVQVIEMLEFKDGAASSDGSRSFTVEVSVRPTIEMPDYSGITVKLPKVVVSDHDIDHQLYHLREERASFNDVERVAAIGDVIALDYTTTIDGTLVSETYPSLPKPFHISEGGWFLLGEEDDFIPGFYAAVVGIAKDEKRTVSLTLADDFHTEELRGKTIVFDCTCTAVKERIMADADDAFAKTLIGEEGTVEVLREEISRSIRHKRDKEREEALGNQVLAYLHDNMQFELPEHLVNQEAQRQTNSMAMNAARSGVSDEELVARQDEILTTATQRATQNLRVSFILNEVARKENLLVSDAQVHMALSQYAARSKDSAHQFLAKAKKSGMIDNIRFELRQQNALEFLKSAAQIEEIDAPEDKHGCAFEKGQAV